MVSSEYSRYRKTLILLTIDAILFIISGLIADWIVFSSFPSKSFIVIGLSSLVLLQTLYFSKFYHIRVSESSIDLINRSFISFFPLLFTGVVASLIFKGYNPRWIPFFIVYFGFSFLFIMGVRFFYRNLQSQKSFKLSSQYPPISIGFSVSRDILFFSDPDSCNGIAENIPHFSQ